jgi:hypothetical protein
LQTCRRCLRILIRFRSIPLSDIYLRPLLLVLGDGREDTYCAFSAECRAAFRETRNTRRSRFPMLEHHLGPTSAVCIHFVFSCRRCLANFSPGIDFNDQREPRRRGERRRRDPSPFIPAAPRGRTREGRIAPLRRRIKDLISRARIMPTSPSLRGGKGGGSGGRIRAPPNLYSGRFG